MQCKRISQMKKLTFNNKILFYSFEIKLELHKRLFWVFQTPFFKRNFWCSFTAALSNFYKKNMKTVIAQTHVLHFIFGLQYRGRNTRGKNWMLCKGQSKESAVFRWFSDDFKSFFRQLSLYLSQNWSSDGYFEVLIVEQV